MDILFFGLEIVTLTLDSSAQRTRSSLVFFHFWDCSLLIINKVNESEQMSHQVDPPGVADQERYSSSINLMMTTFFYTSLF
jgi:hypothetical protein